MKHPTSHGIVPTEYLQSAAIALSLGAIIYEQGQTGPSGGDISEEPIQKVRTTEGERCIFQFHDKTKFGVKVHALFESIRLINTLGDDPNLPKDAMLRRMLSCWKRRDTLHKAYKDTIATGGHADLKSQPEALLLRNTKLVAVLEELGATVLGTSIRGKDVFFHVLNSPDVRKHIEAWEAAWEKYTMDEDHPIYHLRGLLENREFLIRESKKASPRIVIQDGATTLVLPADASPEKLQRMIHKLTS